MNRARLVMIGALCVVPVLAAADPKPKPVDPKPFRDHAIVLVDAQGGQYVAGPAAEGHPLYFAIGPGKPVYAQLTVGYSAQGDVGAWSIGVWAPRIRRFQPGYVLRDASGSFWRMCGDDSKVGLTQLTGDKAKAILDKGSFMTTALVRRPYLLARDDRGIYYYVDRLARDFGGTGYRVFVGKKGAMKELPLEDVASDSGGDVFSTKTGDLRIVRNVEPQNALGSGTWIEHDKPSTLVMLDTDINQALIFKDLGIYAFIGSICDGV